MEVELCHKTFALDFPFLNLFRVVAVKLLRFEVGAQESKSLADTKGLSVWVVFRSDDLKNCIKRYHECFFLLFLLRWMIEHGFRGKDQGHGLCVVGL